MIDMQESPKFYVFLALLLLAITVGGIIDLWFDAPENGLSLHVIFEISFIFLCLGSATYLAWGWLMTGRSLNVARQEVSKEVAQRAAWQQRAQDLLKGLGQAIDDQLDTWHLTPAEKETALFLLKGYSHKEIAQLSEKSERTVRQHAVAVYRKSGLSGRAELSAFFLEDLLLPLDDRPA